MKLTQSPAGVVLRMLGKGDEASAARAEQLGVAFGLDIVKYVITFSLALLTLRICSIRFLL